MPSSDIYKRPRQAARRYVAVAQQILAPILNDDLRPGDRLPSEAEIARQYGVSRATAREAILALELAGALEVVHGEGVFVREGVPPLEDLATPALDDRPANILEARLCIEPRVASLASDRWADRALEPLRHLLAKAENLASSQDSIPQFSQLGLEFHISLAPLCGNPLLASMAQQTASVTAHPLWRLVNQMAVRDPSARTRQLNEHRNILEKIAQRDANGAYRAMDAHLRNLESTIFDPAVEPSGELTNASGN